MKILDSAQFVSEKMKIVPLSDDDFNRIDDSDIARGNNGIRDMEDFINEMRSRETRELIKYKIENNAAHPLIHVIALKHREMGINGGDLFKSADSIGNKFESWEKTLSVAELVKKHIQFSKRKPTPDKTIAAMYCALKRYKPDLDSTTKTIMESAETIISAYAESVRKRFGLSLSDIADIFTYYEI